jgi:hypothetical protein
MKVKVNLHPDLEKGFRNFDCKQDFYVQDELEKDKLYRFMHLFNFKNNLYMGKELDKEAKLIHWLPVSKNLINIEVLMDDGSVKKGLGEKGLDKVKLNEIVQFERCFFCVLEKKEKNKMVFVYSHR